MNSQFAIQSMPWLQPTWQQFIELYKFERLPHAIMLNGLVGVGKSDFAAAFAAYILCETPSNNYACNQCHSCALRLAGSHPDYHLLHIEEKKTQISVEQVRDLIDVFQEKSHQGGYKVAIVDPADTLNKSSANALLKTLEEPGGDSLIILVVDAMHKLPATIRSRCLLQSLVPGDRDEVARWLTDNGYPDLEQNNQALAIAGNAPLTAKAIIEQDLLFEKQRFYIALLGLLKGKLDPVSTVEGFVKSYPSEIIDWLYYLVKDALANLQGIQLGYKASAEHNQLMQQIASINQAPLLQWLEQIIEARRLMNSTSNINIQLILENLLVRWIAISK